MLSLPLSPSLFKPNSLFLKRFIHGCLRRETVQQLLSDYPKGTFIVRLGSQGLVLSLADKNGIIQSVPVQPQNPQGVTQIIAHPWAIDVLCREGKVVPKKLLLDEIRLPPVRGYVSVAQVNADQTPQSPPEEGSVQPKKKAEIDRESPSGGQLG